MYLEKSKINNISKVLDEITLQELQDLPSFIGECSICKMPEIGFLLCLPFWKPSDEMTDNDFKIQNLEFKVCFINSNNVLLCIFIIFVNILTLCSFLF